MTDQPGERSIRGSEPPYGPPIFDAIASGDLQRMKAVEEAARKVLYDVQFDPVPPDRVAEVKDALNALSDAISRLERRRTDPD